MKHIHFYEPTQEILSDLYMADDFIPMAYFEKRYEYSQRMIRTFVSNLRDAGFQIEYKRNQGYKLLNKENIDFQSYFPLQQLEKYLFKKEVRWMIEITLFMVNTHPISLSYLADTLFISKTAAKKDVDEVKNILNDFNMILEKNTKGHFIREDANKKLDHLLDIYSHYDVNVQLTDSIFTFLFKENSYNKIFQIILNHLITYNIEIDDDSMIRYINYVFLLGKVEGIHASDEYIEISHWYDEWFQALKEQLDFLDYDENLWQCCKEAYYLLLLKTPTKNVQITAQSMVDDFAKICGNQEHIHLNDSEKNILLTHFEQWILNQHIQNNHSPQLVDEIKKQYVESFEMANILKYIFESNGFSYSEEDMAYFALFLNDLIVKNNGLFDFKVRIIVIYNSDSMIYYHIRETIDNTLDSRLYSVEGMNLFRFNTFAKDIDPSSTLVIDTSKNSNFACVKYKIPNLRIYPLLYRKDIENIRNKVTEIRIQNHNMFIQNTLEKCKPYIHVSHIKSEDVDLYKNTDFYFSLQEGLFVKRTFDWDPKMDIFLLDQPIQFKETTIQVLIQYSYGDQAQWIQPMKITKNYIIKHISIHDLMTCESTEKIYQIIQKD